MSRYPLIPIGNVASFLNGLPFKPSDWSKTGHKIIRIQNLTDPQKPYNRTEKAFPEKYIVKKGDVLVSWSGTIDVFIWDREDAVLNQHIFKVKFDHTRIDKSYFIFALKRTIDELSRFAHGSTMKHIIKSDFDNHRIPLPPLPDQIRIANILSKAESLIRQRKESLRLLDEFLKSTFLEMFGDPVRNEKGWDQKPLDQIISDIKSGWSPVCEEFPRDDESQLAILKLSSVTNGEFNPDENKKLKESTVVKKRVEPKRKDVLFSRKNTRDLVGATAYLFKDYPNLLLPDTIFKIEYKPERINGIFLWRLLSNNHIRAQLTKLATGSAGSMPNISKKKLMALQIIVPPLKVQNHFARIVEQSQEVKEHYRASQQSLENLYQSLSQRVFSDPSILGKRTQHDQNVLRDEKTVV